MFPKNILTSNSRDSISHPANRRLWLTTSAVCLMLISAASTAWAQKKSDPLMGKWQLNPAKSHYAVGEEPRKEETFTCKPDGKAVSCVIRSLRADGTRIEVSFAATYDGPSAMVKGIPEVDEISLHLVDDSVVAATLRNGSSPVAAYRAERSGDGRTLTVNSVDPITRRKFKSVVVYDRVGK
jgi:hypothetical protein